MWAFMPKCHWLPFFAWCISGSRSPLAFLVELGAAISVASTTVLARSVRPLSRSKSLTTPSSLGKLKTTARNKLCSGQRRQSIITACSKQAERWRCHGLRKAQ